MNKVIFNQCVTPFVCDVFHQNHQSNKYNHLIYLYFIHAPTPLPIFKGMDILYTHFISINTPF
ncbi:MAG: hypothetical protein WCK96_09245 [Methylococcales bacterium]